MSKASNYLETQMELFVCTHVHKCCHSFNVINEYIDRYCIGKHIDLGREICKKNIQKEINLIPRRVTMINFYPLIF